MTVPATEAVRTRQLAPFERIRRSSVIGVPNEVFMAHLETVSGGGTDATCQRMANETARH